jgi:hypothetical protein
MIRNAKEAGTNNPEDKSDIAIRLIDDIWADNEAEALIHKSAESYLITIPEKVPASKMKALKELLEANKGNVTVELFLSDAKKKIKLPFGVDVSDTLKQSIDSILS